MRRVEIALSSQLSGGDRWHKWVCVDLPVRVVQGYADFHAAVLEGHDVLDFGYLSELAIAIPPHIDDELDVIERKSAEALFGILRKDNDLTDAARRLRVDGRWRHIVRRGHREGRKEILEDRDVVTASWKLCRICRVGRRRERIVFRRRKKCSVLPIRGICNPLCTQW